MNECRYKGLCRIECYADFDSCYPCGGYVSEECFKYEPMPDAKALLKLADEMDERHRWCCIGDAVLAKACARRIREALGVGR